MNSRFSFILSTCDNYSDLWPHFFHLLRKYWKGFDYKIYLCTETKQFQFDGLSIITPNTLQKTSTWSENLMATLDSVNTDFIIFMLDDFWLKSPVDTERLNGYMDLFENDKNIGFLCLLHQPSSKLSPSEKYPPLVQYPSSASYRVTTQIGLWRKDYLKRIIRKHESAWQFETWGSLRSRRYPFESYVLGKDTPSLFNYDSGGVLFRGRYVTEFVGYFIKEEGLSIDMSRGEGHKANLEKETYVRRRKNLKFWYDLVRSLI